MKKLGSFLAIIIMASATVFSFGELVSDKREVTDNGIQLRLEITGSDEDGYDVDASNPGGEKRDCRVSFTLAGTDKDGNSIDISKDLSITVSNTGSGWYNAAGEAGMKGKKLRINSFSASCR